MADQLQKVHSRSTFGENINMWGALHANMRGELIGWLVDTWTEASLIPHLRPKMHWVPRTDGKFYNIKLSIGYRSSMAVLAEDLEIEAIRAAYIRKTLELWEQEWSDGQLEKA